MITKVEIKDNTKSAVKYIKDLDNFKNGTVFEFKPGINIIVGENGSGKTTLMKLIRKYLLVGYSECERGEYNSNISSLYDIGLSKENFLDGVDVYGDYKKNVFKLCHSGEKNEQDALSSFESFGTLFTQKHSSTGEGVLISLHSLFRYMFSKNAKLTFDFENECERWNEYVDYVKAHRVDCADEYTILMDEPDRNLSISNIEEIKGILSFHKEQTQIICVIHNPLLIYWLSNREDINIIEMSEGYVDNVVEFVEQFIKK